ncbi:MAG: hypothetical protein EBV06_09125 [Planctomycetia bacterium]|nr:hypothetical protein [Planctomycetia bacterium]
MSFLLFLKLVALATGSRMIKARDVCGGWIMVKMRQMLFAGGGGGLLLLAGCATPMFGNNNCGYPNNGLLSRLGLRRSTPVCAEPPIIGTTVSSVPVVGGCSTPGVGPVLNGPTLGGTMVPGLEAGPLLPGTIPPYSGAPPLAPPYPGTQIPPTAIPPATVAPGTLPPPSSITPGEARPSPAGPSSRRA